MKSLATLIRLQKTYVDEQRLILARMQEKLDLINRLIAQLEIEKMREQGEARKNPANAVTYGAFLKKAVLRGRMLDKERLLAIKAVEAEHDKLSTLFEEQKRYEIAEAARIEAEVKAQAKRETQELDEIGGVIHSRRKRGE